MTHNTILCLKILKSVFFFKGHVWFLAFSFSPLDSFFLCVVCFFVFLLGHDGGKWYFFFLFFFLCHFFLLPCYIFSKWFSYEIKNPKHKRKQKKHATNAPVLCLFFFLSFVIFCSFFFFVPVVIFFSLMFLFSLPKWLVFRFDCFLFFKEITIFYFLSVGNRGTPLCFFVFFLVFSLSQKGLCFSFFLFFFFVVCFHFRLLLM